MRMGRTVLLLASVAAAMLLASAVGLFRPVGFAEAEVTDSAQGEEVDLTITKKADEPEVDVGEELTYEITVANNEPTGTQPVTGLIIRDLLQEDVDEELEADAELLHNRTLIDDDEVFTDVNDSDGGPVR